MNVLNGDFRAVVVNPVDPNGGNKCQVKVLGMMEGIPDEDLPWAEYLLPLNYQFTPNQKGDHVWVDFPYNGDTRRPRIYGAAMDWQGDGKANVPAEAGGKGTAYTPPSGGDRPAGVKVTSQQDQVISRNKLLEVRSVGGGYSVTNTANGATVGFNEAGDLILVGKQVFVQGNSINVESSGAMKIKGGAMTFEGQSMNFTAGSFAFKKG